MSIDEVNPLTEPVDIYGSFIDKFYESRKAEVT
jgi:transcription elongation factor Elf1